MAGSMNDTIAATWASSALGLDYQINRSTSLADALEKPSDYFRKRQTAMEEIKDKINEEFLAKFKALKAAGLPPAAAQSRAETYAQGLYNIKMEDLNFTAPASINELAANMMYKQGEVQKSGLDIASAVKTGKPRRSRKAKK